jgi:hypothetical protein
MFRSNRPRINLRQPNREAGQVAIVVVLLLGLFLLGFVGLATDYSNLWFHRQAAQGAADAACQAGAMDMLLVAESTPTGGSFTPGFTAGTAFSCSGSPSPLPTPCWYAAKNGYDGAGFSTGTNTVAVSFPTSVPGYTTPAGLTALAANPFMRVDVTDRVKMTFSALIGRSTQDVVATAKCGLVLATAPIPIIVLHPTAQDSLSTQGNPAINILGGPVQSIQVNSSGLGGTTTAVNIGGSAAINLTKGGPSFSGSYLGAFGGPYTAPGGFTPSANWNVPSSPISDPFASTAQPGQTGGPAIPLAPTVPAWFPAGCKKVPCSVGHTVNGCPDTNCDEYTPGSYPAGICVGNSCPGKGNNTAIFDPGLYYVTGGLQLASGSTVRPSLLPVANDDGSGGTLFFFAGDQTVSVDSNSGKNAALDAFAVSRVTCPKGTAPDVRLNLPTTLGGNILMAPCSLTGVYYDANGKYRGMLFFEDRTIQASTVNPNWGGGGQFLLAGTMYFHQCNASGTGVGCTAPSSTKKGNTGGFASTFTLQGNSGSGTYVLGEIITDILQLGGTSGINMALNPNATFPILKVQLLQ